MNGNIRAIIVIIWIVITSFLGGRAYESALRFDYQCGSKHENL